MECTLIVKLNFSFQFYDHLASLYKKKKKIMVKKVEVYNFFKIMECILILLDKSLNFNFKLHFEREGMLEKDKDNCKGHRDFERVFAN